MAKPLFFCFKYCSSHQCSELLDWAVYYMSFSDGKSKLVFLFVAFLLCSPSSLLAEPAGMGLFATFHTSMGDITCKLFVKKTPETVKNFVELVLGRKEFIQGGSRHKKEMRPFYDDTIFHRVLGGFLIEGGDHEETGKGGPGYYIKPEISRDLSFDKPGRLAMARDGLLVNGSIFFITARPAMELSGTNPIFGTVVKGLDVVRAISNVAVGVGDKPLKKVYLFKVSIRRHR